MQRSCYATKCKDVHSKIFKVRVKIISQILTRYRVLLCPHLLQWQQCSQVNLKKLKY